MRRYGGPHRLIYTEADVAHLRRSADLIISKIDSAAPRAGDLLRDSLFKYWKDRKKGARRCVIQ